MKKVIGFWVGYRYADIQVIRDVNFPETFNIFSTTEKSTPFYLIENKRTHKFQLFISFKNEVAEIQLGDYESKEELKALVIEVLNTSYYVCDRGSSRKSVAYISGTWEIEKGYRLIGHDYEALDTYKYED